MGAGAIEFARGLGRGEGAPRRLRARRGRARGVDGGGSLMRLFCFGCGYTAEALLRRLAPRDMTFAGTRTGLMHASEPLPGLALFPYAGDRASAEVRRALTNTSHILVSIPPDLEGDVVLRHYREELAG